MAFAPTSTFRQNQRYLKGDSSFPGTPVADLSDDIRIGPSPVRMPTTSPQPQRQETVTQQPAAPQAFQQPQAQTPQQPAQPQLQQPQPIQQLPSFQQAGTLQQRLYQPLETGAEQVTASLGEAADFFRQEAGPSRTYEGIGAEQTLGRAITGGAAQDVEAARGLTGAQYGGPAGLDPQAVAGLQQMLQQMRARQQALGTGGGLQTLIQQSVAGLTPGQARFEAQRQLPEARERARDIGFETVSPLAARLREEREKAQAFAEQRAGEERDIAERSRAFLTGERGRIEEDLASKIAGARQQQEQEAREYQDVVQAAGRGDREALEALRAADPELASSFETEARRQDIQADKEFQAILDDPKFAAIKDIDPLGLTITKRGKQFYSADGQDLRRVIPDKKTRALLYERQQELEKKFDVGTARPFSRTAGPGEFSAFRPLYGGEEFVPPEVINYLGFDPGTRPSRENLSSTQQKEHFNRIQDVLGNLDRIGDAEPFRAAQIFGELDFYLEDEEAALEAKKEELTKTQEDWYRNVKKARKKARKAAREKEFAQIAGIFNPLQSTSFGAGLSNLAADVGTRVMP